MAVQLAPIRGFFFFNDTATTEIYTLSLHDALPISLAGPAPEAPMRARSASSQVRAPRKMRLGQELWNPKSTRLKFSHDQNSYAGFWLKKRKLGHLAPVR